METTKALLVDAFTADPLAGAPAGVVPDASALEAEQMQVVARELGAPVTAFVLPATDADRRLRYFSPSEELDRSPRAAVAAHAHLFERAVIDDGTHTVVGDADETELEVTIDGTVWLDRPDATVEEATVSEEDVADALGIDVASLRDVGADLPLSPVQTGRRLLFVPINYFEHLSGIDPDFEAIADCCERAEAEGLYAFTFDTIDGDATLHGRCFDARADYAEVPASVAAAGGVGALVRHHGAIDAEVPMVVVEQGHFLDRPGRLSVDTDGRAVRVGGRAVTALDGDCVVPPVEDDEIIEV